MSRWFAPETLVGPFTRNLNNSNFEDVFEFTVSRRINASYEIFGSGAVVRSGSYSQLWVDSNNNRKIDFGSDIILKNNALTTINGDISGSADLLPGVRYFIRIVTDPVNETLPYSVNVTLRFSNDVLSALQTPAYVASRDVLLVNPAWSGIWRMNGTSPVGWSTLPYAYGAAPTGAGDFNQDGQDDLIMVHPTAGWSGIWTMSGTSPVGWTTLPYANGALPVGAGDFNQDGKDDLIMVNPVAGWSGIWTMTGTTPTGWTSLPYANGALPIGAGDFNNDGKDDLIMVNAAAGWSGIWTMTGTTPTGWTTLPYANGALPVGAGDFNNDGKADLLMANAVAGWSGIWNMAGTTPVGWTTLPYVSGAMPV